MHSANFLSNRSFGLFFETFSLQSMFLCLRIVSISSFIVNILCIVCRLTHLWYCSSSRKERTFTITSNSSEISRIRNTSTDFGNRIRFTDALFGYSWVHTSLWQARRVVYGSQLAYWFMGIRFHLMNPREIRNISDYSLASNLWEVHEKKSLDNNRFHCFQNKYETSISSLGNIYSGTWLSELAVLKDGWVSSIK